MGRGTRCDVAAPGGHARGSRAPGSAARCQRKAGADRSRADRLGLRTGCQKPRGADPQAVQFRGRRFSIRWCVREVLGPALGRLGPSGCGAGVIARGASRRPHRRNGSCSEVESWSQRFGGLRLGCRPSPRGASPAAREAQHRGFGGSDRGIRCAPLEGGRGPLHGRATAAGARALPADPSGGVRGGSAPSGRPPALRVRDAQGVPREGAGDGGAGLAAAGGRRAGGGRGGGGRVPGAGAGGVEPPRRIHHSRELCTGFGPRAARAAGFGGEGAPGGDGDRTLGRRPCTPAELGEPRTPRRAGGLQTHGG
mmetsp:Transcript_13525/g.37491  ORF Transcript_13525/g.37491 Transcript_13525/m.37491 type:complete len:310 (+) Transcript_13525:1211-2140(+)